MFSYFNCKNCNIKIFILSTGLYICVFIVLLLKIIKQGQLYHQLVKLIVYTCFCFSGYKNCNTTIVIPTASQVSINYLFS